MAGNAPRAIAGRANEIVQITPTSSCAERFLPASRRSSTKVVRKLAAQVIARPLHTSNEIRSLASSATSGKVPQISTAHRKSAHLMRCTRCTRDTPFLRRHRLLGGVLFHLRPSINAQTGGRGDQSSRMLVGGPAPRSSGRVQKLAGPEVTRPVFTRREWSLRAGLPTRGGDGHGRFVRC